MTQGESLTTIYDLTRVTVSGGSGMVTKLRCRRVPYSLGPLGVVPKAACEPLPDKVGKRQDAAALPAVVGGDARAANKLHRWQLAACKLWTELQKPLPDPRRAETRLWRGLSMSMV